MLEKFAPAFLAGVPVVVKPAEQTGHVTARVFADMVESGPAATGLDLAGGAPRTDGLLDHLTGQDVVAFTGSAATAAKLRQHPTVVAECGPVHRRGRLAQLRPSSDRTRSPANRSSTCSSAS